ncbi:MAG: hypothetical protein II746_04330 [Bacteroidaceae bacterium]|jgi:hypothetical protein|nr:hypothetical protein [Bacteroidaceae bacterium]MBQ7684553.1 hypothetical protein [Bacteroidaceae bacterium]
MKKRIMSVSAALAFALFSLSSCITINSGAALAEKSVIGPKMGEAKSTIILGLWSSKGEENNIQQAAKNGGIKQVTQVEYVDKSIFLGIVIRHTTRVYGE